MIPSENNPFRTPGKLEEFASKFMAEDDKKPLIIWFDKFEKVLKKLGTSFTMIRNLPMRPQRPLQNPLNWMKHSI